MNNYPEKRKTDRKEKKSNAQSIAYEAARQFNLTNKEGIPSDVFGSYIGTAYDGDKPDQDADDI